MVLPICIAAQARLKRRTLEVIYEWRNRCTYAATNTANVKGLGFQQVEVRPGELEDFGACKAVQIRLIFRCWLQSESQSLVPTGLHALRAPEQRRDLRGRLGNVARRRRVRASGLLFAWQTALRKESGRRPALAML